MAAAQVLAPTDAKSQQKRKRSPTAPAATSEYSATDKIRDIYLALKNYDPSPSILEFSPIKTLKTKDVTEPVSKRAKINGMMAAIATITSNIDENKYSSITSFVADVESATEGLLASVKPEAAEFAGPHDGWHQTKEAYNRQLLSAQANVFKKVAKSIAMREFPSANFNRNVKQEEGEAGDSAGAGNHDSAGKTVLTLFGNAQGHKQLFSSLQKGLPKRLWKTGQSQDSNVLATSHEAIFDLRDDSLPSGITTTRIIPTTFNNDETDKKPATFADRFTPKTSLPPLAPPKPPKNSANRTSTITFSHDTSTKKSGPGYTVEKLPVGQWLGYGGIVTESSASTTQAKRRNRSRTLSQSESAILASETARTVQEQAKEEALFRSAYSSFAPSKDNSTALYPESVKSQVWWDTIGEASFWQVFSSHGQPDEDAEDAEEAIVDSDHDMTNGIDDEDEDEEQAFREAVEAYEPPSLAVVDPRSQDEKETDELLADISDMLETLYSYQRIRNSTLTSPHTSISATTSADLAVTPTAPSPAERELFKTLQMQLALMVDMLPPYAVARLNGDQLAELNISRHIDISVPDVRGVMAEDQATRLANQESHRAAAAAAAASTPRATNTPTSYTAAPRTAPPARTSSSSSYYPTSSQPGPRQPPTGYSRTPLASWQTPAQQAASSSYRTPSTATASYPNAQPGTTYGTGGTTPRPGTAANLRTAASATYTRGLQPNGTQTPGQYHNPQAQAQTQPRPALTQQQSSTTYAGSPVARSPSQRLASTSRPGSGYQYSTGQSAATNGNSAGGGTSTENSGK